MGYAYRLSRGGGFKVEPIPSLSVAGWADNTACLYWTAPGLYFDGVTVRASANGYPSQTSGDLVYDGEGDTLALSTSQNVKGCLFTGSPNTTYYFSVFSYVLDTANRKHYSNVARQATYTTATYSIGSAAYTGAFVVGTEGGIALLTNGVFTVPIGIRYLDVFCVGGGGKGGNGTGSAPYFGGGGGGAGYTVNSYHVPVTPGQTISAVIGAGGTSGNGGSTSFGSVTASGGNGGGNASGGNPGNGGSGASGGGAGGLSAYGASSVGGHGGYNGANGGDAYVEGSSVPTAYGGTGQGTNTQAFGTGSAYAKGGNSGLPVGSATAGIPNTGNGGDGGFNAGMNGGSGIIIVRKAA